MIDRGRFGSWGIELSEDDLARAVVGVLETQQEPSGRAGEPVVVRSWKTPAQEAAHYRDLAGRGTRFQVAAALPDIAELLARPGSRAGSVFLESEMAETSVVWSYPIRIGLLPGYREAEARAITHDLWPDVCETLELSATASDCDILVLPANFRSSLAAVLERKLTVHADCVLVMGSLDESGDRAMRLIGVLRDAVDAAGVAIANQLRANRVSWFREFIRSLSHDDPLDVALFSQNTAGQTPPMLVASRKLIDATRITTLVRRMAEAMERIEVPEIALRRISGGATRGDPSGLESLTPARAASAAPKDIAADLRRAVEYEFTAESGPASDVGRMIRELPPNLRSASSRLRRNPDERRVVAATHYDTGTAVEVLHPSTKYRVDIRLGYGREGEAVASESFPHHLLDKSETGHRLTVVFAELPQGDGDDFLQPQVRELLLPPENESDPVQFWFRTGDTPRYEARVIVLHQNRVLQTLRYAAPVDGTSAITLDPELDVYRLDNLEGRTRFDAALVANKAGDRMGVCIVMDGKAAYAAPAGLEQQVEKVSTILDKATKLPKLPKKLGDAQLVEVMLQLSHEGNHLLTSLAIDQANAKLAHAPRIQVVAAKSGEYLPVEFLYGRAVPLKLTMCAHAVAALGGGTGKCTTTNPADELCPVEFWGLNRVIEHVAWTDAKKKATSATPATRLFESAVIGLSDRVPKADADRLMKALTVATGGRAHRASSWSDWTKLVEREKPSILVLLTHTTVFQLTGGPALELGGDILPVVGIEEVHVRAAASKAEPVILLLGCDVVRAPIVYQNAVERLKAKHAGVVLGTLSTVLGPHAATFAIALIEALKQAEGKATKFGDVLLDIKRKRISAGDPFALTLVAYGDSEIRI